MITITVVSKPMKASRHSKKLKTRPTGKTSFKTFESLEDFAKYHVEHKFRVMYPNITEELTDEQLDKLHSLTIALMTGEHPTTNQGHLELGEAE